MKTSNRTTARDGRRGSAVVTALVVVGVLGTLSLAMLSGASSAFHLNRSVKDEAGALFVAEAGLALAVDELNKGRSGALGSQDARVDYGSGSYWVEVVDEGDGVRSLTSTAVNGRSASRVELVVQEEAGSFFQWGAFGDAGVSMDSNAHVDSYNSADGPYDDVNGAGNDKYMNANGTVGSNGNIDMSSNTMIFGDAVPGPGGTVVLVGNSDVTGTTTPNTQAVEMPPIEVPVIASTGDFLPSGNVSLGAGDHAFDLLNLDSNSTLTITGPARIVCDSMYVDSNSQVLVDGTNGPVEFWVQDDFVMNSNTLISATDQSPSSVKFNLLTDNIVDPDVNVDLDEVDFDSNAKLYGSVYAPNAHVEINSNFELFGALIAHSVHLDSNSYIHFDEALLESGDESEGSSFSRVIWRERAVSQSEIAYW